MEDATVRPNAERVGYVGLGNMGLPMAQQIAAKYPLVIYTRRSQQSQRLLDSGLLTNTVAASSIRGLLLACRVLLLAQRRNFLASGP